MSVSPTEGRTGLGALPPPAPAQPVEEPEAKEETAGPEKSANSQQTTPAQDQQTRSNVEKESQGLGGSVEAYA